MAAPASPGTVVVKLGGEIVAGPTLPELAAELRALADAGYRLAVVHGHGPQASALSRRLGIEPRLVGGRRITDAATLEVIKMTAAGKVNVDLCASLHRAGARPLGLHDVVRATRRPPRVVSGGGPEPIDFGEVGDITGFDLDLLKAAWERGYLPVVAALGHGEGGEAGQVFNINADIVASELARALRAQALMQVTSVPGVLRRLDQPSTRMARLTLAQARQAIADGTVSGGMIPKLEESMAALELGVPAVHIVAGELSRALSQPGSVGTLLVSTDAEASERSV